MKKKVRFCASWDKSENITKRLLEQFKTSEDDVSNIEFVYDDSYDVIIFNNYVTEDIKKNSESYIFFHEPTWIGNHQKIFKDYENIKIFGFDKNIYTPQENVVETVAHTFYGGRGPWVDKEVDWNYEVIKNFNYEKTKNISSIITNRGGNYCAGKSCLYEQRYNLVKNIISEFNFIDFYGGWGDSVNMNPSPKKIDAVKDYKFCLAVENEYTNNWITEKFYDSILYNTIPIYYGCPNIKEIYPENGYIIIEDIENITKVKNLLNYVEKNADVLYKEMMPNLLKIKEKYFTENNFLRFINNLCK